MTGWTEEQKNAINTKDKSLLVSAGAGSGKTAVLVERIIRIIIEDRIDIRRLLVVTFTKAAAEEMRIRIHKGLSEALLNRHFDGEREFLREQLNYISIASISTFHSFCMSVVKKYYHIINLDPMVKIGDEVHMSVLRSKAMDIVMEEAYEKSDEEFIALLDSYNNKRGDGNFRSIIERIYNITMNRTDPNNWAKNILDSFYLSMDEFNKSKFYDELKTHLGVRLNAAVYQFNIAREIADKNLNNDNNIEILHNETRQAKDVLDSIDKGYECFFNKLRDVYFATLRIKCEDVSIKESIQYHRNKGKDIIKKINSIIQFNKPQDIISQLKETGPLMEYLMTIVFRFTEIFKDIKLDRGMIDFNDLEHYCIEILKEKKVNDELSSYYEYIFVDEYQDSNEIQDTIISAIMRRNNVFFVGDVKQSIYRFRMSDPTMFIQKEKMFVSNDTSITGEVINLNMNFRSSDRIISGINYIFENIMNPYIGEVSYDDKSRLYTGMDCSSITGDDVEITIINNDIDENMTGSESMDQMEVEAHFLADKILQLAEETIYDPLLKTYRIITFGDMAVLLRTTKGWSEIYYTVFKNRGIPVHTETQAEFLDSIEISLIVQLLKVIDNRYQDIPLISVMRSPFFSFSPDELARVSLDKNKMNFYEQIKLYIWENNDELSFKLSDMLMKLDKWKNSSRFISIHDLIWMIVEESGYYYYISAMPDGDQRIANLRMLMDKAREYSESNIEGLFNFIQLIEGVHMTKKDLVSSRNTGSFDNAIRIMSIHKSKGLEFPVVFIGGMGKNFNFQDTRDNIIVHKDLGICPNYVNLKNRTYCPTIFKSIAKEKINKETLSEEMRVLYVAMTRAKQKLYMVGTVKNLQRKLEETWNSNFDEYTIATSNSYIDWIMPPVLSQENKFIYFNKINSSEIREKRESEKTSQIKRIGYLKESGSGNKTSRKIKERLEWVYPYKEAVNIPSKLSLSEYIHMNEENDFSHQRITDVSQVPKFVSGTKMTGIQKGTNIHFIMQHLNLKDIRTGNRELENEIEKQIERMIIRKIVRPDEVEKYFIQKISRFFRSNLGKRMLKSKKVYREKPFNMEKQIPGHENEILMQGVIDCFFHEIDGYVLLDYKSDYYSDEAEEKTILKKYSRQVLLYKEAVEKMTKIRVKNSYIYLFYGGNYREIDG